VVLVESYENKTSGPVVKVYRKRCDLPSLASAGTAEDPYKEGVRDYNSGLCYRARPYLGGPKVKADLWERGFRDTQRRDHNRVDRSHCSGASDSAKQIKLPPEMHGLWCEQGKLEKSKYVQRTTTTYDKFLCKFTDENNNEKGRINIGPEGFSTIEYSCHIIDGSIASSKYTLTLKCMETPKETWQIKIRIYLVQNGPTRSANFRWSSLIIEEL
jgi:hypothetical protein